MGRVGRSGLSCLLRLGDIFQPQDLLAGELGPGQLNVRDRALQSALVGVVNGQVSRFSIGSNEVGLPSAVGVWRTVGFILICSTPVPAYLVRLASLCIFDLRQAVARKMGSSEARFRAHDGEGVVSANP